MAAKVAEKVPATQERHALMDAPPALGLNVPGEQLVQNCGPRLLHWIATLYLPASQLMQEVWPANGWYEPGGQAKHCAKRVAPCVLL